MSKIKQTLSNRKSFIAFLTAGDPDAESTIKYILAMEKAGADLIEIGIPFSDPTAEGEVIQNANIRALKGGMTTEGVFYIVRKVRKVSQIPIAFMTYINPVFRYGYDAFFAECKTLCVDGIILPDLPFEEKKEVEEPASKYGIDVISLIAPTSRERIKTIAEEAHGFIYVVSSMGVTGVRKEITADLQSMIRTIKETTDIPCAIGFGISTPEQARQMAGMADGVIVGSAIVNMIQTFGKEAEKPLYDYVYNMKQSVLQEEYSIGNQR